ncbi:MAG: translational GTPase TypA [Zoogloeaceae bacterium]|jgi:GTP-binding protein|nr:translational GTPase TypA [Zoogloeaceae bacterium]
MSIVQLRPIRNIAIIAHVDHGKTTLVDQLLRQSGAFAVHQQIADRVMDSNDLEKERGITILAKNTSVGYAGIHINIVDTPGHADFGGEVERVLGMVDGVLLLVDAVEGPMPQTRFVTKKALGLGLCPIVVVNKVDRDGANPDNAINHTFDLFDKLGASNAQLDFPIIYASGLNGWAALDLAAPREDMRPLFETILSHVPAPKADVDAPLQLQISALDYSSYVGRIGVGRIRRGRVKTGQQVMVMFGTEEEAALHERTPFKARIGQVFGFKGLNKVELEEGAAGDIVQVTGIEDLALGCTLTDPERPESLPLLKIDEPTLSMQFMVNTGPLAGTEGKFVTSRQIRERLHKELLTDMALRVDDTPNSDVFDVCGRGELHLSILLENMRREGYELAVGRPRVVKRVIDGVECEPFEMLTVDVEEQHQGGVMESLGLRRGEMLDMIPDGRGRVRIEYRIPARGLIGFQGEFMNLTRGTGLMSHVFDEYAPVKEGGLTERRNGVLVSQESGETVAYALWKLQDRGRMFVNPGEKLYEGMIIGIHSRENDLVVNPVRGKQLTNIRASGTDEAVRLVPPVALTLEAAIEFIADDELVEITPKNIRLRKRYLTEIERKRALRAE